MKGSNWTNNTPMKMNNNSYNDLTDLQAVIINSKEISCEAYCQANGELTMLVIGNTALRIANAVGQDLEEIAYDYPAAQRRKKTLRHH